MTGRKIVVMRTTLQWGLERVNGINKDEVSGRDSLDVLQILHCVSFKRMVNPSYKVTYVMNFLFVVIA